MTSGAVGVVLWIPVFVALWIGVIGLAKAGREGAWWTMLSGLVLLTLGLVIGVVGTILLAGVVAGMSGGPRSAPSFEWMQVVMIASLVSVGFGFLLFSIGFAMHGFRARRLHERIGELEMVIEAQNEQLSRSEGGVEG